MTDETNVDELDLSDAELITLLKNHGIDRRTLLTAVGIGAGVSAIGGTAAGHGRGEGGRSERGHGRGDRGGNARIDEVFGAPYSAGESPPPGLVDHVVDLRGPPESGEPTDAHDMFPWLDSPEDGDFEPDTEGSEFFFDPVGLHVDLGDVVEFRVIEPHEHTASAFAGKFHLPHRIPDVPGFSSPPIVGEESWLFRFETPGTYDLVCLPHLPLGMAMRVVVGDGGTDYGDLPDPPGPGNPFANATAVLTDEQLDPNNIVAEGQVAWGDLTL